jgi:hypothetical protein
VHLLLTGLLTKDPATMRTRPLRLLAGIAATAMLASTSLWLTSTPATADTSTTSAAAALSPTSVSVTWAPSGADVKSWSVLATRDADRVTVGMQTVSATATSARFDYLTPGVTYHFTIAGTGAPSGTVWASAKVTTPADALCAGVTPCVAVDANTSTGASTGVGLGLLQGLTSRTDPTRITPLSLNYQRIDAWNTTSFTAAKQAGGKIDVVLSDAWRRYTRQTYGQNKNPWESWDTYRTFIVGVVQWHLDHGLVPDFWEIQNEPDQAAWYSSPTGAAPTRDLVLQQFQVAHDAIRSVLPGAMIVGPSTGSFFPTPGALIDMVSFLDAAVARNLRFDVIAWHELGGNCGGTCEGGPRGIAQNVTTLRALLAQRPTLGQPAVHINEFGSQAAVAHPGYAAGYLSVLAASGVTAAGSSCWDAVYNGKTYNGCNSDPGIMDHLVMPDGKTPRAAWFVWKAYAAMTGPRVPATSSLLDSSVHATHSTTGVIDVLVGRHGASTATASPVVRVAVPARVNKVRVDITTIAPTTGASAPTTATRNLNVTGGVVDLGKVSVPAGAAVAIRITGATSTATTALRAAIPTATK